MCIKNWDSRISKRLETGLQWKIRVFVPNIIDYFIITAQNNSN